MKAAPLSILLFGIILSGAVQAEVKVGERLAHDVCTTCHIVRPGQEVQPVYGNELASFEHIANRRDFNRSWLEDFLKNKHASRTNPTGMPDLRLTHEQIGDVYDYLATLRKR